MRQSIPLNNHWFFIKGFDSSFIHELPSLMMEVDIPHHVIPLAAHYIEASSYQGIFTYAKDIKIPNFSHLEEVFLTFEGVMLQAVVYVNGTQVIHHKGGYLPFSIPLTELVQPNSTAHLIVKVDTHEDPSIPPFGNVVDYLSYGGIYREVHLDIHPKSGIKSIYSSTQRSNLSILHLELDSQTVGIDYSVELLVQDAHSLSVYSKNLQELSIIMDIPFSIPEPHLWSLSDPYLYTVSLTLFHQKTMIDQVSQVMGIRTIAFTSHGFYLNDELVKLRGLNRHQAFPYVGDAMPQSMQEEDARILKYDLGVNMVRTSHYPHSSHFLDACDRFGLLVFEEIPGWQHIGDDLWQQQSLDNLQVMIQRDRHHPSIILWGVRINESPDNHSFYMKTNALAHQLDPSRPTGGVRNLKNSEFLEDVYTYNDFVHHGINEGVMNPEKITKQSVPYLVSEYNGHMFPTRPNDSESHLLEHALRHSHVLQDSEKYSQISGVLGWCMFDYPTHVQFGHADRMCYHGVLDFHREPKLAAAVYASYQAEKPLMEVSTSMNPGAHPGTVLNDFYVFTNCEKVELYKNGELINSFLTVPFKPLHIVDLIGNQLQTKEGFSVNDGTNLKMVLKRISEKGVDGLTIKQKLIMLFLMKKYHLSMEEGARLYTTYMAQWGSAATTYQLIGFIKGKEAIRRIIGPAPLSHIEVKSSHSVLVENSTFQVTRLGVRLVDGHGNVAKENSDVVTISINGPGEIIGPSQQSLVAGTTAFYVRSNHQEGNISIEIKHPHLAAVRVSILVHIVKPTTID